MTNSEQSDSELREKIGKAFIQPWFKQFGKGDATTILTVKKEQIDAIMSLIKQDRERAEKVANIRGGLQLAMGMTVFTDNKVLKDYGVKEFKRLTDELTALQGKDESK